MTRAPVDEIFAIIQKFGDLSYGEEVSQMQHILQCGHLARTDGAPDALIAAALLHDIGQFLDDAGNAAGRFGVDGRHEMIGARYLAGFLPPEVTEPVRLHVEAKRYLCAVEPGYLEGLSGASSLSLSLQGGAHSEREVRAFLALPAADDAIRLRRYDDQGKRRDWKVPDLESYRALLQSQLRD
ncbi:MAG: HD domain-containing protein [Novosphingobium sp.]